MQKEGKATRASPRSWTRIDDYAVELRRRQDAARRRGRLKPRTEPESPRLWLSTLPFLALIAFLALLIIAFAIAAWPGGREPQRRPAPQPAEQGTAAPGWFDEAKREMR